MGDGKLALLFPGQGAHDVAMLDGLRSVPAFEERVRIVEAALGASPLAELENKNVAWLNQNKVTALLTILASSLALDRFDQQGGKRPDFVGGYSVGQWMALHAAGALSFRELASVVARRADAMDACFAGEPGAMLAVFGLLADAVEPFCARLRDAGERVWISNLNAPGQITIAGIRTSIARAEAEIAALKPRKVTPVPVSGAWHTPLLEAARRAFAEALRGIALAPLAIPVVDNVGGGFLPEDPAALREALALHLDHPVRWEDDVRALIAAGATELVEIGWGNTLTKFGMFIDRSVTHRAFAG